MEPRGAEIGHVTGPALQAAVDLLAFTSFGDPTKDALFKSVDAALGGVLADIARAESFEGKVNQTLTVHTHGRLPARRVVVLGAGPRGEFANPAIRDLTALAAQIANRCGCATVGFVVPALGANREAQIIQMATEGVVLGTYKFGRYLTGEEQKRPPSLKNFGFLTDPKGKK